MDTATTQQAEHPVGTYFRRIRDSARSYWHGMSVTLSYMFRKPITLQYPDRTAFPVRDLLPPRYRGFLEVDIDICSACQACERACPLGCINGEDEQPQLRRRSASHDIDTDKASKKKQATTTEERRLALVTDVAGQKCHPCSRLRRLGTVAEDEGGLRPREIPGTVADESKSDVGWASRSVDQEGTEVLQILRDRNLDGVSEYRVTEVVRPRCSKEVQVVERRIPGGVARETKIVDVDQFTE